MANPQRGRQHDIVTARINLVTVIEAGQWARDGSVSPWRIHNRVNLLVRGCDRISGCLNPVSTTLPHKIFHNLVMLLLLTRWRNSGVYALLHLTLTCCFRVLRLTQVTPISISK